MKLRFVIYICTVCMLMQLQSCKNDLNLTPVDQFAAENVWNNASTIRVYINNIYTGVPHGYGNIMLSTVSDESVWFADATISRITRSEITPSDLLYFDLRVGNYGNGYRLKTMNMERVYTFIRYANLFFSNIDNSAVDVPTKNIFKGEVFFLRAFMYHNLVATYGGVPIITKVYGLNDDYAAPRNTYAECIKFISDQCDSAAFYLPLKQVGGDNIVRATKGAAMALKSRTLLYAASDLYNNEAAWAGGVNKELVGYVGGNRTERWTAAKNAAKAVIDLGVYSLYKPTPASTDEAIKNYSDIFLLNETTEDIFIRRFTSNLYDGYEYAPGRWNLPAGYRGNGAAQVIGQLVDDYEFTDGTAFSWSNPIHAANPYVKRDPRLYSSIFYEGASWRARPPQYMPKDPIGKIQLGVWQTSKTGVTKGIDNGLTGYYMRKFMDPTVEDPQNTTQAIPWRFIRYAEVILNYAEACIELGEETEALTWLNKIRTRSKMPLITTTGSALRQSCRHERRIELAFEDHRYFDIRRWMIADQVYVNPEITKPVYKWNGTSTDVSPTYGISYETGTFRRLWLPKSYFLPFALDEMNRNNKLVQNPLY
ncbi:MAG: RagB/SusD family nutrient uptake outer membrane protein [Prolixibacteraceae bacterium]|nr:RagB/SusD family nutrient uptake outer membrane protein [Prolixibacteraceae bacterium]